MKTNNLITQIKKIFEEYSINSSKKQTFILKKLL